MGEAMNQVVVDFDLTKLGSPFKPTDAAVSDAVKLICGVLDATECGNAASFKLDESGEAKRVPSNDAVLPLGFFLAGLVAIVLATGTLVFANQLCESRASAEPPKTVFVTPKDAAQESVEEKKPQVEDDLKSNMS